MALPTFYCPELATAKESVLLSDKESQHAIRARRLKIGDSVKLLDGQGFIADGVIAQTDRRQLEIDLQNKYQVPEPLQSLSIAVAIPKGDRQRTMIDALTQLGVQQIIPLLCERSVVKFKSHMLEKWQRIAVAAIKQSQNPWLPEISPAVSVESLLKSVAGRGEVRCVYADIQGEPASSTIGDRRKVAVLVGPEGGFSAGELEMFKRADLRPVKLGPHILRTEVAAITAAAQIIKKPED